MDTSPESAGRVISAPAAPRASSKHHQISTTATFSATGRAPSTGSNTRNWSSTMATGTRPQGCTTAPGSKIRAFASDKTPTRTSGCGRYPKTSTIPNGPPTARSMPLSGPGNPTAPSSSGAVSKTRTIPVLSPNHGHPFTMRRTSPTPSGIRRSSPPNRLFTAPPSRATVSIPNPY